MPRSSVQLNGYHAIANNAIFTNLRSPPFQRCDFDVLYHLPKPDDAPHPTSVVLGDIWSVHWIRPEAPFMLLVPVNRRPFHGPLFNRLDFTHTIPVYENLDHSWSLRSDVIKDWQTLEHNLHSIWWAMLKESNAMSPQALRYWAWPHRYGYHYTYRNRSEAIAIATRSRNSFIPLMASITYFIIQLDYFSERYQDKFDEWRSNVIVNAKVHPQWFADLESSIVGDLSAPRVGGLVDAFSCQFLWLLPSLRRLNMPLLLHWGPITHTPEPIPSWFEQFAPTTVVIGQLRSIDRGVTGRTYSPEPNAIFPPVEQFSGQRPQETMKQFFDRRKEQRQAMIATESPEKRTARLQRDATVAGGMPPGKNGARVFYWEDVNGFRIRRAAGRRHYQSYWEEDAEYERRFDSVFNEWDICSEFPGSEAGDEAGNDRDADVNDNVDRVVSDLYPLLPDSESFFTDSRSAFEADIQFSSSADLENIHLIDTSSDAHIHTDIFDTTHADEEIAFTRFGFISAKTDYTAPKATWKSVAAALGVSWGENHPSPRVRHALEVFFGYHKEAKSYTDIPQDLYDLVNNDADIHSSTITVRRETLDEEYYFLSCPGRHQDNFELGLTSAATAVQILRNQWGPDLSGIARELLARGIHFHTFIRGNVRRPPARLLPRFRGLGYRPRGYKPDRLDYAAYIHQRNRLLSSPCGRAALLHGGLIARFARGVVAFDEVLDGPSRDVSLDGRVFRHAYQTDVGFWDDHLTEHDIDVLCGVYQVGTRDPQNTTDVSFWPKPSAWKKSGLNIGFWSSDCEKWYQRREAELMAGKGVLRTNELWKSSIRMNQDSLKAAQRNDTLCFQFLSSPSSSGRV